MNAIRMPGWTTRQYDGYWTWTCWVGPYASSGRADTGPGAAAKAQQKLRELKCRCGSL